ncbi:hypothetical protein [Spongiimicrobium sp. 3-5]|uniref:hypothetical protein n=1 Tax=Spongiimicrobium sp. 3-5 TaxID=3332596 RepID=UPI0039805A8B
MKTVLKFTVVIALLFVTVTGMANEPKLYLVANEDAKSLVFKLDNQSKETLLKFMDMDDHLIYSEKISDESVYSKKFDLSNLKDGVYYLETEDLHKVLTYTIAIDKTSMEIVDKKENVKPTFRRKGNMVYVNFLNRDLKAVVLKVYDSEDRLIYKEVMEGDLVVGKAFNFQKAFEDSYTVVVKDGKNTYYEQVSIE